MQVRIEHVALWTEDIERLASFYERYFGATRGSQYANPPKGFQSLFLSFDSGARIELMKTTRLMPAKHSAGAERMGLTHFAVSVGSEDKVDRLTQRIKEDGYQVVDAPRRTGDGYYESVVLDPDGNRIEVTV
jgi:lactoylglutathione lyase